jgi:hypothetical protein
VDIAAAMNKLVDAIAGASSQFKLTRTPITSTIKVTIGTTRRTTLTDRRL